MKQHNMLAIIPARGGSKGLPRKNIRVLAGKPLIAWTIEAAQKSKFIDRIIVSTDDEEIAEVSQNYGAETPFLRPQELATDEAKSDDVILHTLEWIEVNEKTQYESFILLQPTSPLRTHKHIDEAIKKFYDDDNSEALVSVKVPKDNPYWMKKVNSNGYLTNFMNRSTIPTRRQELPEVYSLNGAIYIASWEFFKNHKNFYAGNCQFYKMDKLFSVDVDDELDFLIVEILFSNL